MENNQNGKRNKWKTKKMEDEKKWKTTKMENDLKGRLNTPGTRGGPGGHDRTLAIKRRKNAQLQFFVAYIF